FGGRAAATASIRPGIPSAGESPLTDSNRRPPLATSGSDAGWWRGGYLHRDAEPAGAPGGEGEGSVVCLGDAFDDCEAEADTCVAGAYASGAPLKRLGKRGNQFWGEVLAGVLDGELHCRGVNRSRDPHGALFGQV